jgi:hypothetical protein
MFCSCGSTTFGQPPYSDQEKDYAKHIFSGSQPLTSAVARTVSFDSEKAESFLCDHLNESKIDGIFSDLAITAENHNPSLLRETAIILLRDFLLNGSNESAKNPEEIYSSLLKDPNLKIDQKIDPLDFPFLDEVGRISPITGEPLITPQNKNGRNYVIIRIYPNDLTKEEEIVFNAYGHKPADIEAASNKIAVSPSVAFQYRTTHDVKTYLQLFHEKEESTKISNLQKQLSEIDLGPSLDRLLGKLIGLPNGDNLPSLSYEALEIEQKIPKSETVTYSWVESMVLKFYNFIDSALQTKEEQTQGDATKFTQNVKAMSKALVDSGYTAPQVIDRMAEEFNARANGDHVDRALCMIVVAYFVQHCEVLSK